jgi:hypothetical protein
LGFLNWVPANDIGLRIAGTGMRGSRRMRVNFAKLRGYSLRSEKFGIVKPRCCAEIFSKVTFPKKMSAPNSFPVVYLDFVICLIF